MSTTEELATRAAALTKEVAGLRTEVEQLTRRTKRAERTLRTTVTGVLVVLLLLGVVGVSTWRQLVTESRLNSVVADSLCPVFALVLGGYDPTTRPAGQSRETYEHTFDTFRGSYEALRCTAPLVPPRVPGSN